MLEFIIALALEGHVINTNVEGRIGVRINLGSGAIYKIHPFSPAANAGLVIGDVVIRVDGKPHNAVNISGEPGTIVKLVVKHGSDLIPMDIERIDYREIR